MDTVSPKYLMTLVQKINDRLFELFVSYEDVANYIEKWHYIDEGYFHLHHSVLKRLVKSVSLKTL